MSQTFVGVLADAIMKTSFLRWSFELRVAGIVKASASDLRMASPLNNKKAALLLPSSTSCHLTSIKLLNRQRSSQLKPLSWSVEALKLLLLSLPLLWLLMMYFYLLIYFWNFWSAAIQFPHGDRFTATIYAFQDRLLRICLFCFDACLILCRNLELRMNWSNKSKIEDLKLRGCFTPLSLSEQKKKSSCACLLFFFSFNSSILKKAPLWKQQHCVIKQLLSVWKMLHNAKWGKHDDLHRWWTALQPGRLIFRAKHLAKVGPCQALINLPQSGAVRAADGVNDGRP